ncbi:MAG: GGDEF domain-containing protein [Porticoccaceae bacterium]
MESKISALLGNATLFEACGEDARRQYVIIAILMLTGSVVITALSLWDLIHGLGPAWVNITTLLTGVIAGFLYLQLTRKGKTSLPLILGLMVFLHFLWLITGDVEWSGMFWCLVMLPLYFHLLGHRRGGWMVLCLLLPSAWLLFLPTPAFLVPPYSADTSARFLIAYIVLAWISYLVEYVRYQTRLRLQQARDYMDLQSRTDELTGLANRRGLREYLGEQEKRSNGARGWYAVIVGDLDNFKTINDRYGHDVGDVVLRQVGEILKGMVRDVDLVTRWGGEEFLILLEDTQCAGALVLAKKILQQVADTSIQVDELRLHITLSLGVDTQQPGSLLSESLRNADRAMYRAKQLGKNSVVAHWQEEPPVESAEASLPELS